MENSQLKLYVFKPLTINTIKIEAVLINLLKKVV